MIRRFFERLFLVGAILMVSIVPIALVSRLMAEAIIALLYL